VNFLVGASTVAPGMGERTGVDVFEDALGGVFFTLIALGLSLLRVLDDGGDTTFFPENAMSKREHISLARAGGIST